ncbi:hypothetical protein SADUNF_Sadunf05G0076100 [Salix dunnii]|uniref:S-acyltransferase n=1 Tax=Salix dunnii TaxID=1413687 RepID=A0A835MYX1_9ROSI|nr:hypothetical protein SADUNF_Sadunf05G0076100 [Salix dunnii]
MIFLASMSIFNFCHRFVPCLADPARRSSLGLKAALVVLHIVYAGINAFQVSPNFEASLNRKSLQITLFKRNCIQIDLNFYSIVIMFKQRQPASSKNGSLSINVEGSQSERNIPGSNVTSWTKLVLDMHPPGTSIRTVTCSYCNVEQPPRAKHCHDCDRCVLQFDHHCVWLGVCIGWGNHCRFWWYIFEETALCIWTGILYITYLKANISRAWMKDVIMILLLVILSVALIFLLLLLIFHSYLILTNQTTYELIRRRRIPYLRGIPERVYPFSKGVCRNLYNFCCARSSIYSLERLPTAMELEDKSRPYTCLEFLTCRCC